MKTLLSVFALFLASQTYAQTSAQQKIDPQIRRSTEAQIPFVALMDITPVAGQKMPRRYQHQEVVAYLQNHTRARFSEMQAFLQQSRLEGSALSIKRVQYISASFSGVGTRQAIEQLAQSPTVSRIYLNTPVRPDPVAKAPATRVVDYPYDLKDIKLDQVRAAFPTLLGKNVVIGSVDTGVDGKHPALQGRIKLFYDAQKHAVGDAIDHAEHGTHTAGTMVGTGPNGTPMGIAPEAQLVAAGALGSLAEALEGMQFILDPDNNPATADQPRAVNNSWNSGGASDQEPFYRAIAAWEAANILPVWSAGNAGPNFGSITPPHEHPMAFAIAATQEDGKVASFSSRGPGKFKGQETQKPDIAAPGKNVVSSIPGGKYASFSGTSMAAPHETGAAALLFQIKPDLNPIALRKIMQDSAVNVDESGNPSSSKAWNRVYGLGKLDVEAAVKMTLALRNRSRDVNLGSLTESLFVSPQTQALDDLLSLLDGQETVNPYLTPGFEEKPDWR